MFAQLNFENLSQDMAQGQGEHLASLATLMGVPIEQQATFFAVTQARYSSLVKMGESSPVAMVKAINDALAKSKHMQRRTVYNHNLDAVLGDVDSESLTETLLRLLISHEALKSAVYFDLAQSGPPGQRLARKLHSLLREPREFDADEDRMTITFLRASIAIRDSSLSRTLHYDVMTTRMSQTLRKAGDR